MNQFFHIPFLLILLAKGNTTIHSLLDQNGCKVLAVLCLKDPACGDTEVFYKKCLERLSANFEPYRNLIGFEKVLSNPVTFLSLALFPNYLNKNKGLVHLDPEHSYINPTEHSYSNPTELKNEKEILESENVQPADNYRDKFLLSDASRDVKKETVEEALELIQKLLKKEAIKIQQKKLSTDYEKDSNKLEKVQLQYVLKLPVNKKGFKTTNLLASTTSSISSGKSNNVLEKMSHFSDVSDREEKAILVYSQNEEDSQKPFSEDKQENYLFVYTTPILNSSEAASLGDYLQKLLWNISAADRTLFINKQQQGNQIAYLIHPPSSLHGSANILQSVIRSINTDERLRDVIKNVSGVELLSAHSVQQEVRNSKIVYEKRKTWDKITLTTALICGCAFTTFIVSAAVCLVKSKSKGAPVLLKKQEAVQDYQELLRTQMSIVNLPKPDDKITEKEASMRQNWSEESMAYNMDISTGHVILAYMEDHLKNDNRLNKEWEALCNYRSDDCAVTAGSDIKNALKNRYRDVLPYDHSRVKLNAMSNALHSDYINANFITDIRDAEYIATQGPLHNTVSDFWQMIWEQGVVIIVNLTRLSDMGLPQCHRYWPEDGSEIYHIYEVHLISEHIWCDDYLVRSLYLKNMQTSETRTVTQFHYLTWPDLSVPTSPKPLLDFRRKVNKCYRGHARPIVVHCNNGVGRTGTYILLDMILNKMIKGAKEIDIAAALEHLRDQRADMVKTKGQFDFSLTAMAEEVTAILSSISR